MTYSVLIIEDDPMVLSINKRYVEKISGFTVEGTASSVKEALKLTKKYVFDLLLVDIHLLNESGLDLIRMLRKEGYPADFIMITAINEQETIELCAQYGAIDYILKPFQFSRFKKSFHRYQRMKQLLNSTNTFNQSDIDQFYWVQEESDVVKQNLEKGITQQTLQLIMNIIDETDELFTIDQLTEKTNLSHVSIRKYVNFLEEQNYLETQQKYGAVGRPTMYYQKTSILF